ncbi:hypothetical protein JCM1840_005069 [Sporobolomyces johnsonii]
MGKKGWIYDIQSRDLDAVVQPASSSFIVHRYLPLREHPLVDLVFHKETIQQNSADHWILGHPSDQRLSPDQLDQLHLASLHPGEPYSPLVFARIDPGRGYRQTADLMRRLRNAVDMSIRWRTPWTRGADRAATGTAVGMGLRLASEEQPLK